MINKQGQQGSNQHLQLSLHTQAHILFLFIACQLCKMANKVITYSRGRGHRFGDEAEAKKETKHSRPRTRPTFCSRGFNICGWHTCYITL